MRSLAGLVGRFGLPIFTQIPVPSRWERIKIVYTKGYRQGKTQNEWGNGWRFHRGTEVLIKFLGVWDTVGALGVPDDMPIANWFDDPKRWQFHDTVLGNNVKMARHAVALDERRANFTPTLWRARDGNSDVVEAWFPGVHGNVGGGYADTGLSDITLAWMIKEAEIAGLKFVSGLRAQIKPDARAVLHDSMKGVYKRLPSRPRSVPRITAIDVDSSAKNRHFNPPLRQAPYRPTKVLQIGQSETVDVFARQRWNATGLYLTSGEYTLRAEGEWKDGSIPRGPDGDAHAKRVLARAALAPDLSGRTSQCA